MLRGRLVVVALALGVLGGWLPFFAVPASAQNTKSCAVDSVEVYDVQFTELSNEPQEIKDCLNFYRCYLAEQPADPFLRLFDPACDPLAGACRIDLVVPLLFKGSQQTRSSSFGTLVPYVYWFEGGAPPADCRPWEDPDCSEVAACGTPGLGGQILFDRIETLLSLSVGCSDLTSEVTSEDLRKYSLQAFSCPVGSACPKIKTVSDLDFTPQALAGFLGCPEEPTDDCDECRSTRTVGSAEVGIGDGVAGPVCAAPKNDGPGAQLYYRAGGAGAEGLAGSTAWRPTLGRHWSHSYAQRIVEDPDASHVWLITERATFREFGSPDPGLNRWYLSGLARGSVSRLEDSLMNVHLLKYGASERRSTRSQSHASSKSPFRGREHPSWFLSSNARFSESRRKSGSQLRGLAEHGAG